MRLRTVTQGTSDPQGNEIWTLHRVPPVTVPAGAFGGYGPAGRAQRDRSNSP